MSAPDRKALFVLGAFPPEIEPLRLKFSSTANSFIRFCSVGIGSVAAAAATAEILSSSIAAGEIPSVLFIGTAGSVDEVPRFTLVSATSTMFSDAGVCSGRAYLPAGAIEPILSDERKGRKILEMVGEASVRFASIYSSPSITSDATLARELADRTQARFENLELFGVASAAARFGVPWNAVCPVTNIVGPDAHAEWKKNATAASEYLAEHFELQNFFDLERNS